MEISSNQNFLNLTFGLYNVSVLVNSDADAGCKTLELYTNCYRENGPVLLFYKLFPESSR